MKSIGRWTNGIVQRTFTRLTASIMLGALIYVLSGFVLPWVAYELLSRSHPTSQVSFQPQGILSAKVQNQSHATFEATAQKMHFGEPKGQIVVAIPDSSHTCQQVALALNGHCDPNNSKTAVVPAPIDATWSQPEVIRVFGYKGSEATLTEDSGRFGVTLYGDSTPAQVCLVRNSLSSTLKLQSSTGSLVVPPSSVFPSTADCVGNFLLRIQSNTPSQKESSFVVDNPSKATATIAGTQLSVCAMSVTVTVEGQPPQQLTPTCPSDGRQTTVNCKTPIILAATVQSPDPGVANGSAYTSDATAVEVNGLEQIQSAWDRNSGLINLISGQAISGGAGVGLIVFVGGTILARRRAVAETNSPNSAGAAAAKQSNE